MKAAKYRRISDDREGLELGVTRQDEDLNSLASREDLTIVADYCDNDISASTRSRKSRPEYRRMLADARAGKFDVILAYTSSRLTRRPRELEDQIELAEECGTRFVYVRSPSFDLNTSAGRRVARILAANDAGEAEDIGERVQRQKKSASEAGAWKGGRRPYGYDKDGVTVLSGEAKIVQEMAEQILAGVGLRQLARELNQRGALTSTGHRWGIVTLRQVMLRPRNAGLVEYRREILPGVEAQWPAILDEATWRAVCSVLRDPSRLTNPVVPGKVYLLSRLAMCGVCKKTVETKHGNKGSGHEHRGYRCPDHHVFRRIDLVDATVEEHMVRRLQQPDAADLVAEDTASAVRELLAESAVLRQRLDDLAELLAGGDIDKAQTAAGSKPLRERMAKVQSAIDQAGRRSVLAGVAGVDGIEDRWRDDLPLDRKRRIISTLCEVYIMPTKRGRPPGWRKGSGTYFDPETVQIVWRN